jgi:Fungal specific transcription factor domain
MTTLSTTVISNISCSSTAFIPPVAEGTLCSPSDLPPATNDADSNGLYSRIFRPNYAQRCMEAFYQYFYDTHPFMPPREQLVQLLKTNSLGHLQTAICYVGSRYVSGSSAGSYALEFESYLSGANHAPKDASMVQSMLLFALGLDGYNEGKRAIEVIIRAQNMAIELGMNQREFAMIHCQGSPVCEESLRRTWWELYVVSIMLSGFHGCIVPVIHHRDVLSTVPLPCEEKEFSSGVSPVATYCVKETNSSISLSPNFIRLNSSMTSLSTAKTYHSPHMHTE